MKTVYTAITKHGREIYSVCPQWAQDQLSRGRKVTGEKIDREKFSYPGEFCDYCDKPSH